MAITLEEIANIRQFLGKRIEIKLNSGGIINGKWTDIGLDSLGKDPSKYNGVYVDGRFYRLDNIKDVKVVIQ